MLIRTAGIGALGLAIALFGASNVSAQGPGSDLKKLEADLNKLREQVKEAEAKLARAKEAPGNRFEGKKKGFDKGPPGFEKKGFDKKDFGKGFGGFGKGPGKMDPDIIKTKYEFYKKLYGDSKRETARPSASPFGTGKGPGGFGGSRSLEARIDRLIQELEELRKEVRRK